MARLTVHNHDRDAAGLRYVYPVVSRRAGGVSVGVNLNPNNACNWRCVYCQVPNLVRGAAPAIDLDRLTSELDGFLLELTEGDYLQRHVDPDMRRVVDVALSGNGESTTARPFDAIVARIVKVVEARSPGLNIVLITNGSMLQRAEVLRGVTAIGEAGGEVWFKFDAGTAEMRSQINGAPSTDAAVRNNLRACALRCRTRIQTCLIAIDGQPLPASERNAYVAFLKSELDAGTAIHDVLLYGMARPSLREEADRLDRVTTEDLESFAAQLRTTGLDVLVRS
ncbi:MAG: radical SAM protein [Nannocystaceae bacterium]|nr:radical SAM protein [Nannocystaceae bacterium]